MKHGPYQVTPLGVPLTGNMLVHSTSDPSVILETPETGEHGPYQVTPLSEPLTGSMLVYSTSDPTTVPETTETVVI